MGQNEGSQQETLGGRIGVIVGRGLGLAETFSPRPATKVIPCAGVQDRFDLRFPSAAALPISNQPALSEAESAERDAGQIRQPPRKPHPHPQLRGSTSLFPQTQAHPVGDYQFTGAPTRSTPVLPKPDRREGFGPKRIFFSPSRSEVFRSATDAQRRLLARR